jgi:KUP system potassium uptake protein
MATNELEKQKPGGGGISGHASTERSSANGTPAASKLTLAVLGVVYGDIGTSPIYALRECFNGVHPLPVSDANVLGVLSLVLWTLLTIISLKYMVFVLRADNRGEGGILALLALLRPWRNLDRKSRWALVMLGLFGASLLYGDMMITPAISILSAVEGLGVATHAFERYVVVITVGILIALFALQRRGTAGVGALFGPIIVVWFTTLALLGVYGIARAPVVLAAVNPYYAVAFAADNRWLAFLTLSGVFLVVTGGEALYADLGHFGRGPIRRTWFYFVLPALLLNYYGQGALLLIEPAAAEHPFYRLCPSWALYGLVALSTAATIIASQAAITGAFSLTNQAVQLGFAPRVRVLQTSEAIRGQIYVPAVNWTLMAAAIGLVLSFGSSTALASAYGVSVNSTMAITTVLAFVVARERGGWRLPASLLFLCGFLSVDLLFLGSNLSKLEHGGWFPVLVGLVFFTVLSTWRRGSELLRELVGRHSQPLEQVIGEIEHSPPIRVPGTAVFMTGRSGDAPPTLRHHLNRNKTLQAKVVVLTVSTEDSPRVSMEERIEITPLAAGFTRVILHYGYMQVPNIPSDLVVCKERGLNVDLEDATYYVGDIHVLPGAKQHGMASWRDRLFAFMARNSMNPTDYYHLPIDRSVELGVPLRI